MRDDFPQRTKEILAKRVGMRCSNPNHRVVTSGPHDDPAKFVNIGVAAHITAASPNGKRYNASLSEEERSSVENGIWLCQNCAKLVDDDDNRFTVDVLRSWKWATEQTALLVVERSTISLEGIDLSWMSILADSTAIELLKMAAKSPSRRLLVGHDAYGKVIMVLGGEILASSSDQVRFAHCEASLENLIKVNLLKPTVDGILEVTHGGYELIRTIKCK